MDSLILGVKVILPMIVYMGLGYLFKSLRIAKEQTFREMNRVCFRCFLPVMIFYNIYQSNLQEAFDPAVLVYAVISVFAVFFAAVLFVNRAFAGSAGRSVIIQGIYRSNFVLFGMSVTQSICGPDQMGMASILVAVIIPIFNVLAVILFETYGSEKKNRLSIVKGIAKNPLIIASVLGILVKASGWTIPETGTGILSGLSALATPLALLCLGGTFAFRAVGGYKKELITVCLSRLVIVPLIFVLAGAVVFGFRGSNLVALMVMLASPTAVSSYTMASEMKGDEKLAGIIVVFTSVFSVLTIFLWVLVMNTLWPLYT